MRIIGKAKAGAHKARVIDAVLDDLDVSPPSPYILGWVSGSPSKVIDEVS